MRPVLPQATHRQRTLSQLIIKEILLLDHFECLKSSRRLIVIKKTGIIIDYVKIL